MTSHRFVVDCDPSIPISEPGWFVVRVKDDRRVGPMFLTQDEAVAYAEALEGSYRGHLYAPSYPRLVAEPGPRCPKSRWPSNGALPTQCARRAGHEGNHLQDIMDRDLLPQYRWPKTDASVCSLPDDLPPCMIAAGSPACSPECRYRVVTSL